MRVFTAVFPPDEAVDDLASTVEPVQRAHPDLRWTVPALWHLTLAFFGNITHQDSLLLNRAVGEFVQGRSAVPTRLAGAGAFPDPAAAHTLWAGVACPDNDLGALSRELITSVQHFGWTLDRRAFQPHLTLARARGPQDVSGAVEQLSGYHGPFWEVPSLAVVWSRQSEDGEPYYELLGEHLFLTG